MLKILGSFGVLVLLGAGVFIRDTATPAAAAPGDVISGQYIVVLNDDADADAEAGAAARAHGVAVDHTYQSALKGYAFRGSANAAAAIAKNPRVQYVTPDRVVLAVGGPNGSGKPGGSAGTQPAQKLPTGVQRIGASPGLPPNTGDGIGVAVIDTGIDLTHPDLGSPISGKNCIFPGKKANDDNGHGTHVAGTIAARNNSIGVVGVAPDAKLYAVKVLNAAGSGSWSSVICGIDFVTANAGTIKVANMSLGGGGTSDGNCGKSNNDAMHAAICRSVTAGVTYVVAAGNSAANASSSVPAAYEEVITVSALADYNGSGGGGAKVTCANYGADDSFASFSNYGASVDIAAPGVCILSTWKGGAYNTISGTSMATPHVAGAAALYVAAHAGALPSAVKASLISSWEAGPIPGDPDGSKEGVVHVR